MGRRPRVASRVAATVLAVAMFVPSLVGVGPAASAQTPDPLVRLPGHVPDVLARAVPVRAAATAAEGATGPDQAVPGPALTLTVVLNRSDQTGFDRFLADVQDRRSPNFGHFLSQAQSTTRFGPSQASYDRVLSFLRGSGFALVAGSANRLTLTVSGSRADAERAFSVRIADYRLPGDTRTFFANDADPAVPRALVGDVAAVIGLSDAAAPTRPRSNVNNIITGDPFPPPLPPGDLAYTCFLATNEVTSNALDQVAVAGAGSISQVTLKTVLNYLCAADELNLVAAYAGSLGGGAGLGPAQAGEQPVGSVTAVPATPAAPAALAGTGQRIGLLEFDNYRPSDVADFAATLGPRAGAASRLGQVHVNGGAGAPGAAESEVLVDIGAALTLAPGADVVVYDGPFTGAGTSFQTMFNAMVDDGDTVISNSWSYCEDQTSLADARSIDQILAGAAATGISVVNATGDSGSTCLDGSPGTIGVPADSPSATAVGGTRMVQGVGGTYGTERWWDGSGDSPPTGQGGFGTSRFFPVPAYQQGLALGAMRSIPDVVATADPATGFFICQADAGGCPSGARFGGTSVAAPLWAAFAADLNQAQGRDLGALNPQLYPLARTDAFHPAARLASDFSHVGLGSPDLDVLSLALRRTAAGPVDGAVSRLTGIPVDGIVADGTSTAALVALAMDAAGNTVSGKNVQLTASAGSHSSITTPNGPITTVDNGAVVFRMTDMVPERVTYTATDTTDGKVLGSPVTVTFVSQPAAAAGVVASPTTVAADNAASSTITVTLKDAGGLPATGKAITLAPGAGTHSTINGPTPPLTDAAGHTTFTVTDSVAEAVTYTATDVTDGRLVIPQTATVTFSNAPPGPGCFPGTPTARNGAAFTDFATGFPLDIPNSGCVGPVGEAFDSAGRLYVTDVTNRGLYRFGPGGGVAGASTLVTTLPTAPERITGLAFGKDGRLYAAAQGSSFEGIGGAVVELDPATGAILRTVVGYTVFGTTDCATGIATDPLSGDLFITEPGCGFLGGEPFVNRIAAPAGATPTLTHYANVGGADGITFGPDGTIYVATGGGRIRAVSGTDKPQPATVRDVATVVTGADPPGPAPIDGIAVGVDPADPTVARSLLVNRNDGVITRVDLSTTPPSQVDVFTGGSRGDFIAVGPDACLYATQTDRVVRVTDAGGTCSLAPTNPVPQLSLAPSTVQPSPRQGTAQTLTATLRNVASPAGTAVTFTVTGANPGGGVVATDGSGIATFTYTAARAGTDAIVATATVGTTAVTSNPASVTWLPGPHVTFVTLNRSPTGGPTSSPVTLVADLSDVSDDPATALGGASVSFSLGTQTCAATSDASGRASCEVVAPATAGSYPLSVSYAGDDRHVASADRRSFEATSARPTSLAYTGDTTLTAGSAGQLSATLTLVAGGPLAGRTVGFTIGTGAGSQTCSSTTDATGRAACTLSPVSQPGGPALVTVLFAGTDTDASSTAMATVQVGGRMAAPTISTRLSATTVVVGGLVHDSATLVGATPGAGGTVTYRVYGGSACSGTPVGESVVTVTGGSVPDSFDFAPTAAGPYTWQAGYSGDPTNRAATSECGSEPLTVHRGTVTSVFSSTDPSTLDQVVTFTAGVSPAPGGGTVAFTADGVGIAGCDARPVATGGPSAGTATCATAALGLGSHPVVAVYTGTAGFAPSTSATLTQTVVPATTPTATTLTSSQNPSAEGEAVTFTATVTASGTGPAGTVRFSADGTDLAAPVATMGGVATLTVSALPVGSHTVTATFAGTGFGASSATLVQSVEATLTCDPAHTITGQVGPLNLGPGRWCVVGGAMVRGLTVGAGAAISLTGARIVGPMSADGATLVRVCGSQISQGLTVARSTGLVVVGDPGDDGCAGNAISGAVSLTDNHGGLDVAGNRISAGLTVTGTTGAGPRPDDGAALVGGNQVLGVIACSSNAPPPTNGGTPNTRFSGRTGQCAGL